MRRPVHKMSDLGVIEVLVESERPLVRMVHDHDICCMKSYRYGYFTRRICQRAVTPYCLFPCGAFVARNRGGLLPVKLVSYWAKKKEVLLNQQFHRLVVVSQYMKEELLRNHFQAAKIEIHAPVPRMADSEVRSSFSDVPWMDDRQFAARLEQLLRDKPLAREMGQRGLRLAEERFGFEHYITDLENMFIRVTGEHRDQVNRLATNARQCQESGLRSH
jgi:hypothetical protein